MIMRGAFWSLCSGARLSEAELDSVACGRVAAEGWNQPVDTEHLPLVDHGPCLWWAMELAVVDSEHLPLVDHGTTSGGPWIPQWWTMDHASGGPCHR